MGRLGFNIVRQKEAGLKQPTDPEAAADATGPTDPDHLNEQNQSNETLELGELIAAIDDRDRTIGNLRLLSVTLTAVIVCLVGFIFLTQSRVLQNDQTVIPLVNDPEYANQIEALQRDCDAVLSAVSEEQSRNCSSQLESVLSQQQIEKDEAEKRYQQLRLEHEVLTVQIAEEQRRRAELEAERDDLERKVDAANSKLDAAALVQQEQEERSISTTTEKMISTTTPRRPNPVSLFDSDRFKKINDLVKDIESGAAIFDLSSFMKKTNDAFSI